MSAKIDAIVMGASAGAVDTLSSILPALPKNYDIPVLVVVHIPSDRESVLTGLLQQKCSVAVREAEDKDPITAGTVYFAPPDYHMMVDADRSIALSVEEPIFFSRPSIDALFESAADFYGDRLAGIILTGANEDGARGLKAIQDAGGVAIVQDPDDAAHPAMPQAALKICDKALIMKIEEIKNFIRNGGLK